MIPFNDDIKVNRANATTEYDTMFKIIFIGDEHVGKSSIINRFNVNIFDPEIDTKTVGIDLYNIYMSLSNLVHSSSNNNNNNFNNQPNQCIPNQPNTKLIYKYQLWDCSGNQSYQQIVSSYARDAHVYIYVYDISNRTSFYNIREWQQIVFNSMNSNSMNNSNNKNNIIQILIGNKSDCYDGEISKEEGKKLAESLGMSAFYETSAKSTKNITKLFEHITQLCYTKIPEYIINDGKPFDGKPFDSKLFDIKPNNGKKSCAMQ